MISDVVSDVLQAASLDQELKNGLVMEPTPLLINTVLVFVNLLEIVLQTLETRLEDGLKENSTNMQTSFQNLSEEKLMLNSENSEDLDLVLEEILHIEDLIKSLEV